MRSVMPELPMRQSPLCALRCSSCARPFASSRKQIRPLCCIGRGVILARVALARMRSNRSCSLDYRSGVSSQPSASGLAATLPQHGVRGCPIAGQRMQRGTVARKVDALHQIPGSTQRTGPLDIHALLDKGYRWLERTGEDPVAQLHEARRKERERDKTRPA